MAAAGVPAPLQRMIEREDFGAVVALLEPEDLIIASLRLEGLTDNQIAAVLGVSRSSVSARMRRASQRIIHLRPDLAPLIEGRRQRCGPPGRTGQRPLERGWLCAAPVRERDG